MAATTKSLCSALLGKHTVFDADADRESTCITAAVVGCTLDRRQIKVAEPGLAHLRDKAAGVLEYVAVGVAQALAGLLGQKLLQATQQNPPAVLAPHVVQPCAAVDLHAHALERCVQLIAHSCQRRMPGSAKTPVETAKRFWIHSSFVCSSVTLCYPAARD